MSVLCLDRPLPGKISRQRSRAERRMAGAGLAPRAMRSWGSSALARLRPEIEQAQRERCEQAGRPFVTAEGWDDPRAELWTLWLYQPGSRDPGLGRLAAWTLAVPDGAAYRVTAGMIVPWARRFYAHRWLDAWIVQRQRRIAASEPAWWQWRQRRRPRRLLIDWGDGWEDAVIAVTR
jgi:hypothetical protein